MSWNLLDRPKTQKVTKTLAKQFAEMEPAPHDRPLSERRLQVYQRLLAEGQFRPVTWATALCKETGEVYRVNGKHTSTLLAGLEKVPEFFVTVEEYECDTLEDVARLYSTFDSGMQSRTAADIYLSFASTVNELRDLPGNVIKVCIAALAYEKWNEDTYRKTPAERAELLFDDVPFVVWTAGLFGGGATKDTKGRMSQNAKKLLRFPVVAAMARTFRKGIKASTEFWEAVRDETGPTPEEASRKLAKYLTLSGVVQTRGKVVKSNPREMYVKCLHAWNAWRKGEPTNLKYTADAKVPAAH